MRTLGLLLVAMLATSIMLSACSQSEDKQTQPVKIDPASEQTAREIRKELRAPIDKAQRTQELGDERTDAIDKAVQEK
jgi:cytochrome c-type biogenesis protein CcmH/NrfF